MKKSSKLLVTGAMFDLGVIVVPAAQAQTVPGRATVSPAAPVSPAPPMAEAPSSERFTWKAESAYFEKWMGKRQDGIKACLAKGGTPFVPADKVVMQDMTVCRTQK